RFSRDWSSDVCSSDLRDAFDRYTSTKPAWFYEIVAPGFKYNMPDIAAAIGIHQLKRLPAFQLKRNDMAGFYNQEFSGLPLVLPEIGRASCRERVEDAW